MDNFSPEQYERFEAYRRHALPKQAVRKVNLPTFISMHCHSYKNITLGDPAKLGTTGLPTCRSGHRWVLEGLRR